MKIYHEHKKWKCKGCGTSTLYWHPWYEEYWCHCTKKRYQNLKKQIDSQPKPVYLTSLENK